MLPFTPPTPNREVEPRVTVLEQELKTLQNRLTQHEKNSIRLDRLLQPWVGFISACIITAVSALFCLSIFKGQELSHYLSYFVPIVFPFTGFVFDRLYRYFFKTSGVWGGLSIALDSLVVALSLVRSVYALPYISGHALFLTYALLIVKSWWVRIPVAIVLAQVIYLKAFVWHDSTLYGGLLLGCLAGGLWWGVVKKIP